MLRQPDPQVWPPDLESADQYIEGRIVELESTGIHAPGGFPALGMDVDVFDDAGRLKPELAALAPKGERRMSANPHANGGLLRKDLRMPDFRRYAVAVAKPGVRT